MMNEMPVLVYLIIIMLSSNFNTHEFKVSEIVVVLVRERDFG